MLPGPLGRASDRELPFLAREYPECMEFWLGTGDEPLKTLWVRITRITEHTNTSV